MDRRIIVSLPDELYEDVKRISEREYRSVASLVRESLLDKVEEEFTPQEMEVIEEGIRAFRGGRGTEWRKIKRG